MPGQFGASLLDKISRDLLGQNFISADRLVEEITCLIDVSLQTLRV